MTYGRSNWRPWGLDEAESSPFFTAAIEVGVTVFDADAVAALSLRLTGEKVEALEAPYRPRRALDRA